MTWVRASRLAMVLGVVVLIIAGLLISRAAMSASAASTANRSVTTISLTTPHPYKPQAASGSTDDYHCTLVNPHVTRKSYIISSEFVSGSAEVHHAALFLVLPSMAATVERDNRGDGGGRASGNRFPTRR